MYKISLIFIFSLFSNLLFAQNFIEPQLLQPIRKSIESNYTLKNKQLEANKTDYQLAGVKAKHLPEVSANALYSYIHQSGNLDIPTLTLPITGLEFFEGSQSFKLNAQMLHAGLSAKQIIFSGLQLNNATLALQEKAVAERLMAEAGKEAIAKDVINSFDQLMLLNEAEKLIIETEKRLEKESLRVKTAIKTGLAIPYDRDKITLALLELEAKKIEISGNRKLLYQKLMQLSHMDLQELQLIKYPLTEIHLMTDNANADKRLELQALAHSNKALNYLLKKEKGSALPSIFAFANLGYTNFFNSALKLRDVGPLDQVELKLQSLSMRPNILLGIGAKWELFAGGAHKQKVAMAKTDILINENTRLETQEKLNLLIQKTKTDYENAQERIKIDQQRIKVSQNNMNMAGKQYQEGLITITERLESENDWFKSSLAYYSRILEQRMAALSLLEAQGLLLNQISK